MIVFEHSLGSVWQAKAHEVGGTCVWNTTGIDDGQRIRPRSELYGQVAFARRARLELLRQGTLAPSTWITNGVMERSCVRKLRLIIRAPAYLIPDCYLVTVTESLIGELQDWDAKETEIISHSRWNRHQELMLLMRPFGWVKGKHGTATLIPFGRGCEWRTASWSSK